MIYNVPSVHWCCWLGARKGIRPVKNWVVGCWHGYLSGARCRLAYGPADATATHCLLLRWNPDWFYLSGTGSPWLSRTKGRETGACCMIYNTRRRLRIGGRCFTAVCTQQSVLEAIMRHCYCLPAVSWMAVPTTTENPCRESRRRHARQRGVAARDFCLSSGVQIQRDLADKIMLGS